MSATHSKSESEHRPSLQIKVPKYAPRGISGAEFLSFLDSSSSAPSSSSSASSSSAGGGKVSQLIVDVRDSDAEGGHVKGSKNHPHFESEVDTFIKQVSASGSSLPTRIIFICQYGKERSKAAAAAFVSQWQSTFEKDGKEPPEVCYVKGGFTEILNECVTFSSTGAVTLTGKHSNFFEAFDSNAWVGVKDPANIKPFVAIYKKDVDSAYVLLKK